MNLVAGGSLVVLDTPKSREKLSFLDSEQFHQNFLLKIEELGSVSQLYRGIQISEMAIRERYPDYELLNDVGDNPKAMVFTRMMNPLGDSSSNQKSYEVFRQEKTDQAVVEKKTKKRKSEPMEKLERKKKDIQNRKNIETSLVIDLTNEPENLKLIQQLKDVLMKAYGEEVQMFIRTNNGDVLILDGVDLLCFLSSFVNRSRTLIAI